MSLSKKVVLTVSGYKISLSDSLRFYQNDQLKLIFEINKYGIDVASSFTHKTLMPLQPLTATLFIETPLGVDSIESANIEDNAVTFYLTSNQTQHVGTSSMQIKLTDDDGCQITLPSFTFEVRKNIYDNAVHVSGILLADENGNALSDENGNTINATATTESSKQIKDFSLKTGVSGQEDILIQDNGVTKRIKSNELIDTVDLTGYATETYVQNKIAEASLSGGEVDLSGYATKTELNTKANVSHTHTKSDITDLSIPTKTSQLTNDSGFIASIPSEYVTETELSAKSYATETYVQNKIAEASLSGGEVDLSGYATKDDLNVKADKSAIPTKVSQLANDKGYLTSHQDISEKADKIYVDTELAKKANSSHTHSYNDLTDKPTIPSISNLATKTELTNGLATKADKTELHSHSNKTVLDGITSAKVTEWNNKSTFDGNYNSLTNKPTIPTVDVNKNYVDTQLAAKANKSDIPSLNGYATKDDLNKKADKVHTHDQYLTEHQDISTKADKTELHSHSNKTVLDGITSAKVTEWNNKSTFDGNYNSLTNKPTIPTVPTKVSSFTNDAGYLTSIPSEYVTETELNDAISGLGSGTGNVSSNVIKSIAVVDELPTVEEPGVLYLIKNTGTSTEPETPGTEATNLYYQSKQKDYNSSSSGYNISWKTDCNVLFNSTAELTREREQTSGDFTLNLVGGKTYKLKATYISGEMTSSTGLPAYHIYLKDGTTSTKYCELSLSNGKDAEESFIQSETETLTAAKMCVYIFAGTKYTNLIYNITLTEVN